MKKIIGIIIVTLLITSIVPGIGVSNTSSIKIRNLNKNETKIEEVQMFSTRNIQVSTDGDAVIDYNLDIPQSPWSEIYKDSFGIENPVQGMAYDIPESIELTPVIEFGEGVEDISLLGDVNADGIVNFKDLILIIKAIFNKGDNPDWSADLNGNGKINFQDFIIGFLNFGKKRQPPEPVIQPVREPFLQGVKDDMQIPLGFGEIIHLGFGEIIPLGEDDATSIMVQSNSPNFANYDSQQECMKIQVGPWYENATHICWEFLMTKILFLQLMLGSLQIEDASYYLNSITTFELPESSTIINAQELNDKIWSIDFTNGTYLTAVLTVNSNQVILTEEFFVSTNNITIPDMGESYSYQRFDILYIVYGASDPISSDAVLKDEKPFTPELKFWQYKEVGVGPWSGDCRINMKATSGATTATGRLLLGGYVYGKFYIAWNWNWFTHRLEGFISYFKGDVYSRVIGEIETTGPFKKVFDAGIMSSMGLPAHYWIGANPMHFWVFLKGNGYIDFTTNSKADFYISFNTQCYSLTAGIGWNPIDRWNPIFREPTINPAMWGPSISTTADMYICPSQDFTVGIWWGSDISTTSYMTYWAYAATWVEYPARTYTTNIYADFIGGVNFDKRSSFRSLLGSGNWIKLFSEIILTRTGPY